MRIPDSPPPSIVLLHGTLSGPWVFRSLVRELHRHGYQAYPLSYGHFGTADLSLCVRDIAHQIRRQLPGSQEFIIIGHSLGGLIGLRLARHPDFQSRISGLIGLGAAYLGVPPHPWWNMKRYLLPLLGPAFHQLVRHRPQPPQLPDTPIFSVVSPTDQVVPGWSSRLGDITEVDKVKHSHLPRCNVEVLDIIHRIVRNT
ncbi:alpha/beta fold hydrolase [Corynebacterium sp. 3HC-13]|uniref:esterase/lipase family protein n=1 Tax=Corynebacterium poyangense TaxID=2684405 RepID=UPI001CCB7123|nr:alpha/beta fold hydrolase [Corynebacterium poyangense]MBZ8177102.1 alpha/beta fold hydrolase [Corynebacterium poyangense]